jgi:transketolase
VVEECVPRGGLAGQVKELAWEARADCRLDTFTLRDEFIHNYGAYADLLAAHGLDVATISRQVGL